MSGQLSNRYLWLATTCPFLCSKLLKRSCVFYYRQYRKSNDSLKLFLMILRVKTASAFFSEKCTHHTQLNHCRSQLSFVFVATICKQLIYNGNPDNDHRKA